MAHVLYLTHDATWTESRVADVLRAQGHEVEFRCPVAGAAVPTTVSGFDALVVGGHTRSVGEAERYPDVAAEIALAAEMVRVGRPYLGLCFGAQVLGAALGTASVPRADGWAEYGFHPIEATPAGAELFDGVERMFQAHYEGCAAVPAGAVLLARSPRFEVQAFRVGAAAYGFQFHPDARLDMIDGWWRGETSLRHRPGADPLERQLADAVRYEPSIQRWTERFLTRWLEPPDPGSGSGAAAPAGS